MTRRSAKNKRGQISFGRVLFLLALLLLVYLYDSGVIHRWLGVQQSTTSAPAPTASSVSSMPTAAPSRNDTGSYQAFFNTPALVYPDVARQRVLPPMVKAIIDDIDAAQTSVDVATFDFDLVDVVDALIGAHQRGVQVRVVLDDENLETPEVARQMGRLEEVGIQVRFESQDPFMHSKFIVIDNKLTWTGSWNITINDTYRNNNNMVRFNNEQIAANYSREFQQLFSGKFGVAKTSGTPYPRVQIGNVPVEVYFSPTDGVAQKVLKRLNEAKSSIHFMTFSFTSDPIADVMIEKHKQGLEVRGVFDRQSSNGTGAEYQRLVDNGIDVLIDGNCYILHHKVIIIDKRIVITGSYNFTNNAERNNDENIVIIEDQALAQAYLEEFDRVYAHAQAPSRCR
jgi:phosphatidylserine/phosphatidylglycerophosphate/cardiolipin synthase-like enzyme